MRPSPAPVFDGEKRKLYPERPSDPPRLLWLSPRAGLMHETAWEGLHAPR